MQCAPARQPVLEQPTGFSRSISMSIQDTIRDQVANNKVVLYMKGTPQFPR